MGFDIQRFVDQNIDEEFICNICQDVLEDPLMIATCEHLYCGKCIRDCIKAHGVCPQDRSSVSINKLVEPIRIVRNLLNKLKVRCNLDNCQEVFNLGELQNHLNKCEANPENKKIDCFCKKGFTLNEFKSHKDLCLDYHKSELNITRVQLSTYTTTFLTLNDNQSTKVASDSEIKFLYKQLRQSLSKSGEDYSSIQKSLLYISSKLIIDENDTEKDLLSTIRYVKYGFEDICIATDRNYDNCCDLISNNGFDYMFLANNTLNNKHINRFIVQILKSISKFEDLMVELINKKSIKLLLNLMNEKNDMNTSIDSATILSDITLMGADLWQQQMPDYNRKHMLKEFRSHIVKWKLNRIFESDFETIKELFKKLKSDKCTPEVTEFFVYLLALMTRNNPEKYIPMIESEKGFEYLKILSDSPNIENHLKNTLEIILNKWIEWKEKTQNSVEIV